MTIDLDTNVLVSGLLNPSGSPAAILSLVLNGSVKLAVDNRILLEYTEVLQRPKFGFKKEWIQSLLDFIQHESLFVTAAPLAETFPDEDDRAFYEVAISGSAEKLVTGNSKHFPASDMIVSPAEFLHFYLQIT